MITTLRHGNAVRPVEAPAVLAVLLDAKAAFVHQRSVPGTQQQVVERRLAAETAGRTSSAWATRTYSSAVSSDGVVVTACMMPPACDDGLLLYTVFFRKNN